MNSINIISSHVSPTGSSPPTRSNSITAFGIAVTSEPERGRVRSSSTTATSCSSNKNKNKNKNKTKNKNQAIKAGSLVDDADDADDVLTMSSHSLHHLHTPTSTRATVLSEKYSNGFGEDSKSATTAIAPNESTPLLSSSSQGINTGNVSNSGSSIGSSISSNTNANSSSGEKPVRLSSWPSLPNRIALTVWHSLRWVLQTLIAPGVYLINCFYDEQGVFAPVGQLRLLFGGPRPTCKGRAKADPMAYYDDGDGFVADDEKSRRLSNESEISIGSWSQRGRPFFSESSLPTNNNNNDNNNDNYTTKNNNSQYAISSESESDFDNKSTHGKGSGGAGSGTRRKGTGESERRRGTVGSRLDSGEESPGGTTGNRRSVRIKLNEDTRQRKHRKGQQSTSSMRGGSNAGGVGGGAATANTGAGGYGTGDGATKDISAQLKSPTSPAGALTKYPRTPAPPRPLIPRRQPSYLNLDTVDRAHQKTLVLDLDETLIHSMSKGGRMSTGHMVEVRLNTTFVNMGGQPSLGPQHPILYYVHKRPYCDEFLRRVCKWYNLVVFTASVQEYADPVIDWLESERKYFSARYYRQHCTFRHGAFIKDLSAVEPDLSKVMILDNSPLSYLFHQDNAIPIQGWISDHTDNDLLHLVPLLEGLQYVSDVRALLALRGGEDGRHMA